MRNVDGQDDNDDEVQPKKRKLTKSASRSSLDQFGGELDSPTASLSQMSAGGSEGGWDEGPSGGAGGGGVASKAVANKGKGKKEAKPSSPLNSDDEGELAPVSQTSGGKGLRMEEEEDGEEEPVDVDVTKHMATERSKISAVMVKFTPDQMSRYECFRRSGFQRSNMRRLLSSVAGCPISVPMTIVMSGIAKMFVGELVETGRTVMTERNDTGPIRPCHIREAYRRLKLENKVPLRHRPRLFR